MSKISALASVYYKEKPVFLDEALASVYRQTMTVDEVVIVHDGPLTQDLYKCLKKWKKKLPIKEIVLPENKGLGEALNVGLRACSHEIVARFDTDDINTDARIEAQYRLFQENPNLQVLSSNIEEFDYKPGDLGIIKEVPSCSNKLQKFIRYRNPINHMSVMLKKTPIIEAGGYQELSYLEDYYLWLRVFAKGGGIANISKVLVHARIGNGMVERRKGVVYFKSEFKLFIIKQKLKITKGIDGFAIFLVRAVPRLFPVFLLKTLYNVLRRKH